MGIIAYLLVEHQVNIDNEHTGDSQLMELVVSSNNTVRCPYLKTVNVLIRQTKKLSLRLYGIQRACFQSIDQPPIALSVYFSSFIGCVGPGPLPVPSS
jgi:hypothetical protein